MIHSNIKIYNDDDNQVKIVVHGAETDQYEADQVRIIIRTHEARALVSWGFKPCTVLDVKLWGYPYSFTMLEDGFLVIAYEGELVTLDESEVALLKVSLYTLLTSGKFATDCTA